MHLLAKLIESVWCKFTLTCFYFSLPHSQSFCLSLASVGDWLQSNFIKKYSILASCYWFSLFLYLFRSWIRLFSFFLFIRFSKTEKSAIFVLKLLSNCGWWKRHAETALCSLFKINNMYCLSCLWFRSQCSGRIVTLIVCLHLICVQFDHAVIRRSRDAVLHLFYFFYGFWFTQDKWKTTRKHPIIREA